PGGPSRGGVGGPHQPASGRTALAPAICETNRTQCASAAHLAAAPATARRCAGAKRCHARPQHTALPARCAAGLLAPASAPPPRRRVAIQSLSGARHAAPDAPRSTSVPSVKPQWSLRDQIGISHTAPLKQALRAQNSPPLFRSPARAGRLRPALRPPRARLGSMSTRCAPGRGGIVTSRWPCWPMPIWPLCDGTPSGGEDLDLAADLLPLTVPEVRRLLWRLVWARPPDPGRILAWS